MRAFIAIEIPEGIRHEAYDLTARLRHTKVRASWVKPERMHLTLRFLGDITKGQATTIGDYLKQAHAERSAFPLELFGIGAFPNIRKPNVIWIGVTPADGPLAEVQQIAEDAAQAAGLSAETRPFRAHLTLARIRDARQATVLRPDLEAMAQVSAGSFSARHVALFSSRLTPRGPIYTALTTCELT